MIIEAMLKELNRNYEYIKTDDPEAFEKSFSRFGTMRLIQELLESGDIKICGLRKNENCSNK